MTYLQRLGTMPTTDGLSPRDVETLQKHFDVYAKEVLINGEAIRWDYIEEIEVAVAARAKGPSGWLVKYFVMGGDRYHIGFYFGYNEAVLTNLTREAAAYVLKMVAYYAPVRIKYAGPDDLVPLTEF
jgi:hypothetical protein